MVKNRFSLDISSYLITKFIEKGEIIKSYHPDSEVWADYLFLAACHAIVIQDDEKVKGLITEIKVTFPDYNPFSRLSWGNFFLEEQKKRFMKIHLKIHLKIEYLLWIIYIFTSRLFFL